MEVLGYPVVESKTEILGDLVVVVKVTIEQLVLVVVVQLVKEMMEELELVLEQRLAVLMEI